MILSTQHFKYSALAIFSSSCFLALKIIHILPSTESFHFFDSLIFVFLLTSDYWFILNILLTAIFSFHMFLGKFSLKMKIKTLLINIFVSIFLSFVLIALLLTLGLVLGNGSQSKPFLSI